MEIIHRKLGRERAYGLADNGANIIEIDSRLKGRHHLEIAIHETLHLLYPEKSETVIARSARRLANVLWRLNYRRVDNSIK